MAATERERKREQNLSTLWGLVRIDKDLFESSWIHFPLSWRNRDTQTVLEWCVTWEIKTLKQRLLDVQFQTMSKLKWKKNVDILPAVPDPHWHAVILYGAMRKLCERPELHRQPQQCSSPCSSKVMWSCSCNSPANSTSQWLDELSLHPLVTREAGKGHLESPRLQKSCSLIQEIVAKDSSSEWHLWLDWFTDHPVLTQTQEKHLWVGANNKTMAPRKQGFNKQRFDSQPTSGAAYPFLMQANGWAPASLAQKWASFRSSILLLGFLTHPSLQWLLLLDWWTGQN